MKSMNKNGIRVLKPYINLSAPESRPSATHNGTKHPVCIRVMRIQRITPHCCRIWPLHRSQIRDACPEILQFGVRFPRDNRTGDISQTTARCDETGTFGQNFPLQGDQFIKALRCQCHLVSGARRHRPDPLHGTSDTTSWHRSESRISFPAIWRTMLTPARFTRAAIGCRRFGSLSCTNK